MRVAVEGCAHGELELIYDAIAEAERYDGKKVDLLLCCGDFQATRNLKDLRCMAVPDKYKDIGTFYKYYSGEKKAPVLTIFVGGNHEASNHLQELSYGGWVAPNIYYLGYAGVVSIAGIRIAGISGIYKNHDLMRGHHEYPPYSDNTIRSVYHIRNLEIFRLKQLTGKIDIFMSHDWPQGITEYGNVNALLRKKPFLRNDIENNSLGSPPGIELLKHHYPSHWFAAHLHCKFAAIVENEDKTKETKFLALDKCLPKRKFLQIVDIEHDENLPMTLSYDLEWLTILFLTNHLMSIKSGMCYMPGPGGQERWIFSPTEEEKERIRDKLRCDLSVPLNFRETVDSFNPDLWNKRASPPNLVINEQTTEFCCKLGIDDPFMLLKMMHGINDDSEISSNTSLSTSINSNLTISSTDLSCSTEEDESGASFIIDTTPSFHPRFMMSSLKLPAARNDSSGYLNDSLESEKEALSDSKASLSDSKARLSDSKGALSDTPKSSRSIEETLDESLTGEVKVEENCKKFKRRNQSIYGDSETECPS